MHLFFTRRGGLAMLVAVASLVSLGVGATPALQGQSSTVNWESPHVSPLAITPDGNTLLAVNTPDARLEVFDITSGNAVWMASVPVGIDPVSVRARTSTEVWVVNHISDTLSIVDLTTLNVVATLPTADEPADVAFAGIPQRAFVSCSQANRVQVFDPAALGVAPVVLPLVGQDPRALAVSADGSKVYVAIFESGNGTTILGGGSTMGGGYPPNMVSNPAGPYGGVNPPPNMGAAFDPPKAAGNPAPPPVGLIVRKSATSQWLDDNGGNWTPFVSGASAGLSGRPVGWDLTDHDVAIIDTNGLSISYVDRLMNLCMHLAVHPVTGQLTVVGTEAMNEVRFEPNLKGIFVRVGAAFVAPMAGASPLLVDLNPHLTYVVPTVAQPLRDQSIGDPRGIVWNQAGTRAYVSGKGSNNVVVIDGNGARSGVAPTIEVGAGPTGLALDEARNRLYVLNHFGASVSVVNLLGETELARVSFYDPTPPEIRQGRRHLYGTHETSGLGQAACGSCHIDSRMDLLAWDLGDPSGAVKPFNQNCLDGGCGNWHPMKGPMTTQTLQDIIGKEPHHWRGDRNGIEEFNGAFQGLLGDDVQLTTVEMQEFEDFLATIHFPPNPFRNFDNTLPTSLPLPGHFTTGAFGAAGLPLPNGNAQTGLNRYRTGFLDAVFQCVTCHTLPTGAGADMQLVGLSLQPIPPGPNGERHLMLTSLDGSTNSSIKIPQLRNMHEKVGFEATQVSNTLGFGFLHDGSVDSLTRFVTEPVFSLTSNQDTANMVAFMLAFSGSDLPQGSPATALEPPGVPSLDTHAAVGNQVTVTLANQADAALVARLAQHQALADAGKVGWVAKGRAAGLARGYAYVGGGMFQSDRAAQMVSALDLRLAVGVGAEVTFTVVPDGTELRTGIDRDEDGFYDRDELDGCSDPADAASIPPQCGITFRRGDCNGDGGMDISDPITLLGVLFTMTPAPSCPDACDVNDDGALNIADPIYELATLFGAGPAPLAPHPTCGADPTADGLGCTSFAPCP